MGTVFGPRMKKAKLTDAERGVLEAIRNHPFTTQKELAEKLDIARTTVATYVDRLQSKGYLLGRAYVLAEHPSICCFGGTTLDRTLVLHQAALLETSNPATGYQNRGGVARNVAENVARLGVNSKLISVVGGDEAGTTVMEDTRQQGVDTSAVATLQDSATGSYSAILQPDGELFIGVSDLEICEALDRNLINRRWGQIAAARLVFADTNAPADSLAYLLARCRSQDIALCLDAVSVPKACRLPSDLTGVEILFCNVAEAREILHVQFPNPEPEDLAPALCARGAANAVVTAGPTGLWYANADGCSFLPALPAEVVDVSGAGDALIAGTLCGWLMGFDPTESCKIGLRAACITTQSVDRNCSELSMQAVTVGIESDV